MYVIELIVMIIMLNLCMFFIIIIYLFNLVFTFRSASMQSTTDR